MGPDYVLRLILARCPELEPADLADLSPEVERLMVEAIDALAAQIDELALRVEAGGLARNIQNRDNPPRFPASALT
jgi:hypothetical protein